MNKTHRTNDGVRLLISEMTTDHLRATILLILRRIKECKNALEMPQVSEFKKAMYNDTYKTISKDQIKSQIYDSINGLHAYISEAMLRGLNFTGELQEVFERSDQEVIFSDMGKLLLGSAEINDDSDDDSYDYSDKY